MQRRGAWRDARWNIPVAAHASAASVPATMVRYDGLVVAQTDALSGSPPLVSDEEEGKNQLCKPQLRPGNPAAGQTSL